jgi:hypothetical protein
VQPLKYNIKEKKVIYLAGNTDDTYPISTLEGYRTILFNDLPSSLSLTIVKYCNLRSLMKLVLTSYFQKKTILYEKLLLKIYHL